MKKIVLLVIGCYAVLTLGAAGAYFTSQSSAAENIVRAGTVVISTEPTSAAINIDALAPGATITQPMTVVNSGNLPVSVVVTAAKKAGITEFYEALTCRVIVDGAALYDGPMSGLRTTPLVMKPGSRAQYQFAVGLPATAGNELLGDYAKLTLYVDAEQVN
jgi:hypothetical protein